MIMLITLITFFLIFFFVKKHIGPSLLAVIAGLSVYEAFGQDFVNFLTKIIDNTSADVLSNCIYVTLVIIFPLILYFQSSKGGLFGIFRIAESAVFASLLTILLVRILLLFFPFDQLSRDILEFLSSIKGPILLGGILTAYFDLIFYRG